METLIALPPGETILLEAKPHYSVIFYWLLTTGLRYVMLLIFCVFLVSLATPSPQDAFFQFFLLFFGLGGYFIWALLGRAYREYILTERGCFSAFGILNRHRSLLPYDRIANVYVRRNLLERLLGISSVIAEDFSGTPSLIMVGLKKSTGEMAIRLLSERVFTSTR